MTTKTIRVTDTNVIIQNPAFFDEYRGLVVMPMITIEEFDKLKNSSDSSVAAASRHISKTIDASFNDGEVFVSDLITCVKVGLCYVLFPTILKDMLNYCADVTGLDMSINDNQIVAVAYLFAQCAQAEYGEPISIFAERLKNSLDALIEVGLNDLHFDDVALLSNDLNVRIKAAMLGITALPYNEGFKTPVKDVFNPSRVFVDADPEDISLIQSGQPVNMSAHGEFIVNEYCIFQGPKTANDSRDGSVLARATSPTTVVDASYDKRKKVYGITPRDSQQHFAINALMDPSLLGVSLIGPAGTGKTLLALAAGLHQTLESRRYKKVMVAKAPIPAGKDVGFLPGTLREKLEPWMGPIFDNLDVLHSSATSAMKGKTGAEVLENMGHLEFVSTSFIRGRSISDCFIIIDEAQNLSIDEVKLILTRVNDNCKIVLCGDPEQIDTRGLTRYTNGLTLATQAMRSDSEAQKIFASVVLTKSQRSVLAKLAAQIL